MDTQHRPWEDLPASCTEGAAGESKGLVYSKECSWGMERVPDLFWPGSSLTPFFGTATTGFPQRKPPVQPPVPIGQLIDSSDKHRLRISMKWLLQHKFFSILRAKILIPSVWDSLWGGLLGPEQA